MDGLDAILAGGWEKKPRPAGTTIELCLFRTFFYDRWD